MQTFTNKTILITGGTGSFGNVVLERFLSADIREIRIFSRDEKKQEDMRLKFKSPKIKFYIGDVRDISGVNKAMSGVNYVFHAAALKQVPSCEFFPLEAIKTNTLGTENVINSAINNQVERVVLLSTDKAVYPINAMGLSKAMAEKLMIARSRNLSEGQTVLCITRYGNVLNSRGSVIPLFIDQILSGNKITITDPQMTRFLMTLEESVDLVMHAFENGRQGDIFIQKSPSSTILDLANAIKKLFGSSVGIEVIGTRHGEKLFETLVSREEMVRTEDLGRYFRVAADLRDLNYSKFFSEGELAISSSHDYTSHNAQKLNVDEVVNLFKSVKGINERMHD